MTQIIISTLDETDKRKKDSAFKFLSYFVCLLQLFVKTAAIAYLYVYHRVSFV